jgi:chlorite dismutase
MMSSGGRLFEFCAGNYGAWRITANAQVSGAGLSPASFLSVQEIPFTAPPIEAAWSMRGVRSHDRYVNRPEKERLVAIQPELGRTQATCAALIPIRKSDAWWALAQDERRAIVEEKSRHITIGLQHLPAVARRLYHCRDLGQEFDFITWFEFAPIHADQFEALVADLRATHEWTFVDREVDIRLTLAGVSQS